MSWFQNFFTQGNTQPSQPVDEVKRQDFTGVLQAIVEETIMVSAQWLVGVVNQRLINKITTAENSTGNTPEEAPINTVTTAEELLIKLSTVVEQLHDRNQMMGAIEDRISTVEQSITEQSNLVNPSESTLPSASDVKQETVSIEELVKEIHLLTEQTQQNGEKLSTLENRVTHLEKLLARYSVIPKIVEQQSRAIVALQSRLLALDASENNSLQNGSQNDRQKFEPFENNHHKIQPESIIN